LVAGFAQAQTTVTLTAPNILGVSCGGYRGSKVTLVGFDANGNLQATVYEIMSCCSGVARNEHQTTHLDRRASIRRQRGNQCGATDQWDKNQAREQSQDFVIGRTDRASTVDP